MRRLLAAALAAAALTLTPTQADAVPIVGKYATPATDCGDYTPPDINHSVVMFGDSITQRTTPWLLERRPNWEVNGLGGRQVDCLTPLVAARLDHGYVGKLVIALGTNGHVDWTRADYQEVVDMVPDSRAVIFVNTFRDPDIFNVANGTIYEGLASTQYKYSRWMAELAAENPNVCVAPYRQWAIRNRELLGGGVHPRQVSWPAREAYADIVTEAVGGCVP